MPLNEFLLQLRTGQSIDFQKSMEVIDSNYQYFPTEFRNGLTGILINEAGRNEGSCKIFAFGKLHNLSKEQTLAMFGHYYRQDVLGNPDGNDHANIRQFIRDGWDGIAFQGQALLAL